MLYVSLCEVSGKLFGPGLGGGEMGLEPFNMSFKRFYVGRSRASDIAAAYRGVYETLQIGHLRPSLRAQKVGDARA
jgi:hypothetical protein